MRPGVMQRCKPCKSTTDVILSEHLLPVANQAYVGPRRLKGAVETHPPFYITGACSCARSTEMR